jgi:hypothetical protein
MKTLRGKGSRPGLGLADLLETLSLNYNVAVYVLLCSQSERKKNEV